MFILLLEPVYLLISFFAVYHILHLYKDQELPFLKMIKLYFSFLLLYNLLI